MILSLNLIFHKFINNHNFISPIPIGYHKFQLTTKLLISFFIAARLLVRLIFVPSTKSNSQQNINQGILPIQPPCYRLFAMTLAIWVTYVCRGFRTKTQVQLNSWVRMRQHNNGDILARFHTFSVVRSPHRWCSPQQNAQLLK